MKTIIILASFGHCEPHYYATNVQTGEVTIQKIFNDLYLAINELTFRKKHMQAISSASGAKSGTYTYKALINHAELVLLCCSKASTLDLNLIDCEL